MRMKENIVLFIVGLWVLASAFITGSVLERCTPTYCMYPDWLVFSAGITMILVVLLPWFILIFVLRERKEV